MRETEANPFKVYVTVRVDFDTEGRMLPRTITWENGRIYEIDRVLDVRPAAAMRAGGVGDRYTIRVEGRQTFLFYEHSPRMPGERSGRWFVERRGA